MSDIASVLSVLFFLLLALYVCLHVALTITEVKSEEAGANIVPAAFRGRVTLAEHRKAVDYTGEIIQTDLVAALIGAVIAIHQSEAVMKSMDAWNTATHGRSGLTRRVLESAIDEEAATDLCLAHWSRFVPAGKSPMCGNTIGQDRRFMARWMPRLEAFFHYRSIDVSTVKELVRRWDPAVMSQYRKTSRHEALSDIYDSVAELRFYREHVFRI